MRRVRIIFLFVIPLLAFTACDPDLIIENEIVVTWNGSKKATVVIKNIGDADAGNFMVYFNGDENPVSDNHRPQVRFNIPSLAAGASKELEADFGPLAHPNNNNLGNVFKITVMVDPKGMVKESNENNNTKEAPIH